MASAADSTGAVLGEVGATHASLDQEINGLIEEAHSLKESHLAGAADSIEKSGAISDKADMMDFDTNERITRELTPTVSHLAQTLANTSAIDFEKADSTLKARYAALEQSSVAAADAVAEARLTMCGIHNASSADSETCAGGVWADHQHMLTSRQQLDKLYAKQEANFKSILTKVRIESYRIHL